MSNQAMEGRHSLRRRIPVALAALALGLGVAACGDDEDEGTDEAATEETASAEEVTLTATEYEFDLSATPTAETESVVFDNQGEDPHVMIFARINEGFTLDEAFELQGEKGSADTVGEAEAKPGKSVTVDLEGPLEPGSYAMLCPIGGPDGPHYKLGQLQEFEIE
jgi:plastocyanin